MRRLSVRVETDGALIQWLAAARQRKVTSTTLSFSLRVAVFSFSTVLAELLKTSGRLESRAQCWFAADIAASLADAGPPRDERADTVKLSGPEATAASPVQRCNPRPARQQRLPSQAEYRPHGDNQSRSPP